jgi:hypothetical protein
VLEKLGPEHIEVLVDFQSSFPPALRHDEAAIRQNLEFLGDCTHSCSWLLLDHEGYATGYIVAYPSITRKGSMGLTPGDEAVIYIADLYVEPGHPGDLYSLFSKMVESINQLEMQQLCLEGICRRSAEKVLSDHPKVLQRLGYTILNRYDYWDDVVGEEMTWLRFAPLRAVNSGGLDKVALSEEFLEDLRSASSGWAN